MDTPSDSPLSVESNSPKHAPNKRFDEGVRERYSIGQTIGEGAFSQVRKAKRRRDNKRCALKIIDKKEISMNELQNEINILCELQHPGCVSFYEWTDDAKYVFVSIELVTGGSLLDRIISNGAYSEEDSRTVFIKIAEALNYLHSKGIAHRDLKPDNVLLVNKESHTDIKLADFGLSKFFPTDTAMMSTVCGTPQYLSPEVLNVFEGTANVYNGMQIDSYCLGILLYIVLSGTVPFYDDDEIALFEKIKKGNWTFYDKIWVNVSHVTKDMIAQLLHVNPRQRMTLTEVLCNSWTRGVATPSIEMTTKLEVNLNVSVK